MLIIEGPDGSGKTTLVNQLEVALGMTREPRVVSTEAQPLTPMRGWVEQELSKGFGPRLYDRFALISSPAYCMLEDPTFAEMRDPVWLLNRWLKLRQLQPIIVLCLPPFPVVRDNVISDPDNRVIAPHIRAIYDLYLNFWAQHQPRVWHYDYTTASPNEVWEISTLFKIQLERQR